MNFKKFIIIACIVAFCGGAVFVGLDQYKSRSDEFLGHQEPAWELLASIEVEDTSDDILPNMVKSFPQKVVDATEDFQVEGYLVRFVAEPYLQEFLIVPDPPECPFCGGAGYGPYLEVRMKQPLDDLPDYTKLNLKGQLQLIDDPTVFDTAKLVDAVLLRDPTE